jgi:hypothetical protein
MKIGIMQPYFLPYIGYYQLMKSVDTFVFYDDVAYIKQGWINRNRILLDSHDYLFILELKGASPNKKINAIEIGNNRMKLLMTFKHAYRKAPFFKDVEPLLHSIFESKQSNLSQYIIDANKFITSYLGIDTKILISSEIDKNNELKRQDKIFEICNKLGATTYINAVGGRELYSKTDFAQAGIELYFIDSKLIKYKQFNNNFISSLSIIDVMMFNSIDIIQAMLNSFILL